jgi:tetratricopeptide (TPR) repeat protein
MLIEEENLTQEHKYTIYHRLGHGYLRLKNYEKALLAFEKAAEYVDTTNMFCVAELYEQRAYCYRFMLKLTETIDTLKAGIEYLNTDLYEEFKFRQDLFENKLYFTKLALIKNIICAYRYIEDEEHMKLFIKELLLQMNPVDDKRGAFIMDIYIDLFDDYIYLSDFEAAESCITKAYNLSVEQENFYYQNEALKKKFLLYKLKDDKEKMDSLFPCIEIILTKYPEKINNNNVAFPYLGHYFEVNKNNANSIMCNNILNLIKKEVQ